MVLYETTYDDDICDVSFFEKIMIGLGGITTVRLNNGEVYDLAETNINYNIRTLSGTIYRDTLLEDNKLYRDTEVFGLDEINEIIFEGFIITKANRENILNLIHENGIRFTKIPRRD